MSIVKLITMCRRGLRKANGKIVIITATAFLFVITWATTIFTPNIYDVTSLYHRNDVTKLNDHLKTRRLSEIFHTDYNGTVNETASSRVHAVSRGDSPENLTGAVISEGNGNDDVMRWKRDMKSCVGTTAMRDGMHVNGTSSDSNVLWSMNKDASLGLDAVIADIEEDSQFVFELELTSSSNDTRMLGDVTLPPFVEYGKPGYLGENGTGVHFTQLNLTKEERGRKGRDFYINNFDVWVSRLIPLHRSLYEARSLSCQTQQYNLTPANTPTISVVIVFHNEAWTTLLRTVHSVLDASPKGAITEIVLLDDYSTHDHLKSPLEWYLRPHNSVVRLLRSTKRLGLIKARNVGFLRSKGEIVVFLDSHVECFNGWLPPLIAPIVSDPKVVTLPTIEIISTKTFKVVKTKFVHTGSLNLDTLAFSWRNVKDDQKNRLYYRSPTMPGGLYAVSRKWFYRMGGYDPGLEVWGGENMEFSFKSWMCGGSILISGCSHVAHVFRSSLPFADRSIQERILRNRQRVAEVWMDEYKHFYYEKLAYHLVDPGDLTNQKQLRRSLECHDFRWYLDHVNHFLKEEMDVDGSYSGLIKNQGSGLCLQADNAGLLLMTCRSRDTKQTWQFTTRGHLSNLNTELTVMKADPGSKSVQQREKILRDRILQLVKTREEVTSNRINMTSQGYYNYTLLITFVHDGVQYYGYSTVFHYDLKHRLVHQESHLCLTKDPYLPTLRLSSCNDDTSQAWVLQTREDFRSWYGVGKT